MEYGVPGVLAGSDIHGFYTLEGKEHCICFALNLLNTDNYCVENWSNFVEFHVFL